MFILSTATVKFNSGHRVATPPKSMFQGLGNLLQGYDWEHHEIAETQSRWEFIEHAISAVDKHGATELTSAYLNLHTANLRYLSPSEAKASLENLVRTNGANSHGNVGLTVVLRSAELTCSIQFTYSALHKDSKAPVSIAIGAVPSAMQRRENEHNSAYAVRIAKTRFRSEQAYKDLTAALLATLVSEMSPDAQIVTTSTATVKKRKIVPADLTVYTMHGGPLKGLSPHNDLAYMELRKEIRDTRQFLSSPAHSSITHDQTIVATSGDTAFYSASHESPSPLDTAGDFGVGDFSATATADGGSFDSSGDFGMGDFADSASADGGSDGGGGDGGGGDGGGGDGGGGCGGGCGG